MKLVLTTDYLLTTDTEFELPEGKTWDDVKGWYVKWCTMHLLFKDGTEQEVEVTTSDEDIDFKFPAIAKIRPVDVEYGGPDWNAVPLAHITELSLKEARWLVEKLTAQEKAFEDEPATA